MKWEKVLLDLDAPPWSAISRFAMGLAILLTWAAVPVGQTPASLLAVFVAMLLLVRIVPVVIRAVMPFPETVRATWARRRLIAKRYDSYQWQKMLWIGLGLGAGMWLTGRTGLAPALLASTCVAGGIGGNIAWRIRSGRMTSSTPVRARA